MSGSENYDECPKCHQLGMPKLKKDDISTGRRCQSCGFVEEFERTKVDWGKK